MARKKQGLDVWLYGHRVAHLTEPSTYRYRLAFTDEAIDVFGDQSRVLSMSLPVSAEPISDTPRGLRPVSAFLEGLLPEGNVRAQVASTLKVLSIDKMALLSRVGAECAGAVQFLPEGTEPTQGRVRPLTGEEVDRLVSDLPTYHLPEGTEPQASLAGIQDKVLLTRMDDDTWGWPEAGAASTHIIKPEPTGTSTLPHLIQTEDWALKVARRAELRAAQAQLVHFDGRAAIVVDRYDRGPDGTRTHQEDFCQALGLEPNAKYESTAEYEQRGSRLSRLVALASPRSEDPTGFSLDLLRAVTYNVAIGNGDAHSKNYSLMIDRVGRVTLAPLYDTAPVMHIDAKYKGTGHVIAGSTNIDWISVETLTKEARSWGLGQRLAAREVVAAMERIRGAIDVTEMPEGAEQVRANLDRLWSRRSWPVPAAGSEPSEPGVTPSRGHTEPEAAEGAASQDVPPAASGERRDAAADDNKTAGHVWVAPYTNRAGTVVDGHWRRKASRSRPTKPEARRPL